MAECNQNDEEKESKANRILFTKASGNAIF